MSSGQPFSIISDSETLTLSQFAARCGESETWVNHAFVYPTDPKTHKPLLEENGKPKLGCPIFKRGRQKLFVGSSVNAWMAAQAAPLPRPRADGGQTK